MRSALLLVLVAAFAAPAASAADSHGEAFQGIPWGASAEQIRAKFPGKVTTQTCTKEQEMREEIMSTRGCGSPLVPSYVVGGVPFDLEFGMLKSGDGLGMVTLSSGSTIPDGDPPYRKLFPQAKYEDLKRLLQERYGVPAEVDQKNDTEVMKMVSTDWTTQEVNVSLILTWFDAELIGRMYSITVTYTPPKDADVGKL